MIVWRYTSLSRKVARTTSARQGNEESTYLVSRCRHPLYQGTTAVVNDGAYADDVSSPPADVRPRTPCVPCDLEADERDASSRSISQPAARCARIQRDSLG